MPLILNYAENKNVINQDNLAKKRVVKALQQQAVSSVPQTDPDLEENADKYFNKIFNLKSIRLIYGNDVCQVVINF